MSPTTHAVAPSSGDVTAPLQRPGPAGRFSALALVLLLALLCAGCAAGRVNLWPIYFHETREIAGPDGPETITTTEALYPLFHRECDGSSTWHAVRPFYVVDRNETEQKVTVRFLWPLGLNHRRGEAEQTFRLFPLFHWQSTYVSRADDHSVHAHFLQVIRWGRDATRGPYLAVFPLGGVTYNVLGPEWSFVLFPLYSRYRRGDYVRYDFPWPVLGFGRSADGTERMKRLWPFYVQRVYDGPRGYQERHFVLWPFFRSGRLDPGGRFHHSVFVAVPFHMRVDTFGRDDELLAYRRGILGMRVARDLREPPRQEGWKAFWGLLGRWRIEDEETVAFFPLYRGTTHYRGAPDSERRWTRRRILWPILWLDADRLQPGVDKRGLVVAPFYWHYTYVTHPETDRQRTERRITLWPLATLEKEPEGAGRFWVVSRGWRDPGLGYKRLYRDILDLFQHHREADGSRETRLLSRLYHHRRGPAGRYLSFMSLFTYDSTAEVVGEEGSYASALFGLFRVSWSPAGRRWRLFYIPFGGEGADERDVGTP